MNIEPIKLIIRNNKSSILLLLFTTLYFSVGAIFGLVHLFYDDFEMLMIAKGESPYISDSFIYYSSSYLGRLYQLMYKINSELEWYNILYLFFISLSFSLITNQLLIKFQNNCRFLMVVGIFLLYYCLLTFLTNVQFTFAAGVLLVNSLISIRLYLGLKKPVLLGVTVVVGFVLAFISSLYRFDMFILTYTLVVFMYVLHDIILRKKGTRTFYLILFFLGATAVSTRFIEINTRTNDQKTFVQFHQARAAFGDYRLPSKITNV